MHKKTNRPRIFANVKVPMIPPSLSPMAPDNPRAMINLVAPALRAAIENLPERFFTYSERELRNKVKPGAEECRLRINFWDEYLNAQDNNRKMQIETIIKGVCTAEYFYKRVITDHDKLGFMIIPPADYQACMREMLDLGWMRLREVLEMDFYQTKILHGREVVVLDHGLIKEIRQIVAMIDERVKGAIVQRMQVQTQTIPASDVILPEATLEQLEAMEKKIERMQRLTSAEVIEVTDDKAHENDEENSAESEANTAGAREAPPTP